MVMDRVPAWTREMALASLAAGEELPSKLKLPSVAVWAQESLAAMTQPQS